MQRVPVIERVDHDLTDTKYDAFVATVGFETRSRHIAQTCNPTAARKVACGFSSRKVLAYQENMHWYQNAGFDVEEMSDAEYGRWIANVVSRASTSGSRIINVCVDISSTSRLRLAMLIETLMFAPVPCDFCVDFVYSFARYATGIEETVVTKAGPVTETFAGWAGDPDVPLAALFGLGYERDKALGVLEFLEPGEVWAFEPASDEPQYARGIREANVSFYAGLSDGHILEYPVKCPFDTFRQVETFVYGIMRRCRVILLPFGPKLFALISLLAAAIHYPNIAVWRVSGEESEPASDRVPTGQFVRLRATFRRLRQTDIRQDGGEFASATD